MSDVPAVQGQQAPAASQIPVVAGDTQVTPMQLLQIATEQGADIDKLTKLMDLQERYEATQARKAFVAAMNTFKASPPRLTKNKHVHFETRGDGPNTDYHHATLDQVSKVIGEALSKVNISHRWKTNQAEGRISVTCVLTHDLGHSEETTLVSEADGSGKKNPIQAIASAVTYLQRYTILAATGMAVEGQDNDGATVDEFLTVSQEAEINGLLQQCGLEHPSDARTKFLQWAKADSVAEIHTNNFELARNALRDKVKLATADTTAEETAA